MQSIAKFLVALVFAGLTAVSPLIAGDGNVDTSEWLQVGVALATAASVWVAANVPDLTWAKTAIAVIGGGLSAATAAITDGISPAEWVNIVLAALAVVFVWAVPNAPRPVTGVVTP